MICAAAKASLQRALDKSNGPETLEDVLADIASGESLLWWDAKTQTAAVTQPIWPHEMSIHLLGGKMDNVAALEASCRAWCKAVGIQKSQS